MFWQTVWTYFTLSSLPARDTGNSYQLFNKNVMKLIEIKISRAFLKFLFLEFPHLRLVSTQTLCQSYSRRIPNVFMVPETSSSHEKTLAGSLKMNLFLQNLEWYFVLWPQVSNKSDFLSKVFLIYFIQLFHLVKIKEWLSSFLYWETKISHHVKISSD